jgi:alkaline phosphatase
MQTNDHTNPWLILLIAFFTCTPVTAQDTGSVIFIHPDGASSSTWAAARALLVGPDADLNWDRIPHIAVYRGHLANSLTASSNGGATAHATGVRPNYHAFGRMDGDEGAPRILNEKGRYRSVAIEALDSGMRVGVIQSGTAVEPGSAVFLTDAPHRKYHDLIVSGMLESNAHVILGGGERHFLPEGVQGVHGPGERKDNRNLVEEARKAGYTVIFTRDELLNLPDDTLKVLGLFANDATFNALEEEKLAEQELPLYDPKAPTLAEMTRAAINVLNRDGEQFLLIVEEEGPDNFGNHNNASGVFESLRRTDETFALVQQFIAENPNTLLITTADSDAGGMRLMRVGLNEDGTYTDTLPDRDRSGSQQDGARGTGSEPFLAMPDRTGRRLPFKIVWAATDDVSGGVLVRAQGLNAERVQGTFVNTQIPELIRLTLFGPSE